MIPILLSLTVALASQTDMKFAVHVTSYWETTIFHNITYVKHSNRFYLAATNVPLRAARARYLPVVRVIDSVLRGNYRGFLVSSRTCVVDEGHPHSSGSLGHFARRLLPWYSIESFENAPLCERFFLTRTPRVPLSPWFSFILKLVTEDRIVLYADDLHEYTTFDTLKINYRVDWFKNPAEALSFKMKAWGHLGLSHVANSTCLYLRSNGRNAVNHEEVLNFMKSNFVTTVISFTNITSVFAQASAFYDCKLLVSPHGSHNANVLFMQPGSLFVELNPYKFYHKTYNKLGTLGGVTSIPSRRNVPVNARLLEPWQSLTDVQCHGIKACRTRARHGQFIANVSHLEIIITSFGWPAEIPVAKD